MSVQEQPEFNPDYVSNRPRTDRLGRPLRTIAQASQAIEDRKAEAQNGKESTGRPA